MATEFSPQQKRRYAWIGGIAFTLLSIDSEKFPLPPNPIDHAPELVRDHPVAAYLLLTLLTSFALPLVRLDRGPLPVAVILPFVFRIAVIWSLLLTVWAIIMLDSAMMPWFAQCLSMLACLFACNLSFPRTPPNNDHHD